MALAIPGVGSFIQVTDGEGIRHTIKTTSISMISDSDSLQNETHIVVTGRTIMVHKPMDEILREIREAQADLKNY